MIALLDRPHRTTKVERLNTASARRVIEPDRDVAGSIGDGQLLADELLSIAGLDLDLTADQRRTLAREEVASITESGIRFEAVLEAGFALEVLRTADLTDARSRTSCTRSARRPATSGCSSGFSSSVRRPPATRSEAPSPNGCCAASCAG